MTSERSLDNKIKFEVTLESLLPENIAKPKLRFTANAYLKMMQLVHNTDTEIGWHGTVLKNQALNSYLITDILVYPQIVSSVTVTTDTKEYTEWLIKQPDCVFNNIRFQGHSHVNMGVTPSGVDEAFYEGMLQGLNDDDFYIFMIVNKRRDVNVWIHDLTQNVIFEKADVEVLIQLEDGTILSEWTEEQKDLYLQKSPITHTSRTITDYTNDARLKRFDDYDGDYYRFYDQMNKTPGEKFTEETSKKDKGGKGKHESKQNRGLFRSYKT